MVAMGGMMKPPVHLARVAALPSHRLRRVSGGDLLMVVPRSTGWWRSNQAGVEGSWIRHW